MKLTFLLLATIALAVNAGLHSAPQLSNGWQQGELLSLDETPVTFVVSLRDNADTVAQIKEIALEVSDPTSNKYGNYLSSSELAAMTAPSNEALETVSTWLLAHDITSFVIKGSRVEVVTNHQLARDLFQTRFQSIFNREHNQVVVRAGDYTLPEDVEAVTAAVFGLHGLPLPPRENAASSAPADVTPAVLTKTYNIGGVAPKSSTKNSQAVAEFQGQYMSNKDLSDFFKKYITNYTVGTDDTVSKYVGDQDKQEGQTEASLDIQYMMGVSPGLKSEFWLWNSMDFCGDLANWTAHILSDANAPLVHSISYGWQGDLAQIHCTDDKVKIVDDNFAKLATLGVSVIFASGDSGSGFAPVPANCKAPETGKALEGTSVYSSNSSFRYWEDCCQYSTGFLHKAWTFTASTAPPSPPTCTHGSAILFKGTSTTNVSLSLDACCAAAQAAKSSGFSFFANGTNGEGRCDLFSIITGHEYGTGALSGYVLPPGPPRPAPGSCVAFSAVTGSKASTDATSGYASENKVKLWPSWPASSGWITAVGATRFVGQVVGAEEMATDQFGSGGGFSWMFNISTDSAYQADVVKAYLAGAPQLPPAGSFPPGGRATPDVSALGEGYMVLQNGHVSPVGGTSASTPAFAGMVGLINEARIQAGGKAMGFLNPFIYKNMDAFTDVTKGNNAIGRTIFSTNKTPYGFNCTKGWDPITGVGTPVFDKLLKAALASNPVA